MAIYIRLYGYSERWYVNDIVKEERTKLTKLSSMNFNRLRTYISELKTKETERKCRAVLVQTTAWDLSTAVSQIKAAGPTTLHVNVAEH